MDNNLNELKNATKPHCTAIVLAGGQGKRMGGKVGQPGTHRWVNREYDMISYLYQLDE